MSAHIILVEKRQDWKSHYPEAQVVLASDYLRDPQYMKLKGAKVVNLCRGYPYLSVGYYCSLLAEARKHKILPSVRTITDLSNRGIYSLSIEDLQGLIQKSLKHQAAAEGTDRFELYIFFGQTRDRDLQDVARQIFIMFRCPLLKVEFRLKGAWNIASIKALDINNIPLELEPLFIEALNSYLNKRWRTPKSRWVSRYDLAILHNPEDPLPPSNERALHRFIRVGKTLGIQVDLITKKDFARVAEYDALFIRETTQINHHTYRFAKKAESEGMVVIDDSESILKCTNKVYLSELLTVNRVPALRSVVLQKGACDPGALQLTYPIVLKIPDGAFSRGIFKAHDQREFEEISARLFKESDLILAQEFLYTEYDWRIGILNRQPLFACQYFMSKHHWQIVKHVTAGKVEEGDSKTWRVEDVPQQVVETALKAANLIGNGLYGVDVKKSERGVFVIEVNDNPNVDGGTEDECLGDELYRRVLAEFVRRIEML